MIDPITAYGVARGVLSTEADISAQNIRPGYVPIMRPRRKLRVLALHGFGQSGDYMRIALKTDQLTSSITETLESDMLGQYDGVEWLCPDAPLKLLSDANYDAPAVEHVAMRAWWQRVTELDRRQDQLYPSLEYLCNYLKKHGPVDGIVGFSQGAAIGMMLAALCEGRSDRMVALGLQGSPVSMSPPQEPFKFAVSCCGFQGPQRFYNGFYNPKISTPSLHVIAEFDTMVSDKNSADLVDGFEDATVIHFRGTHHVPTDKTSLHEIAMFMANTCARKEDRSPIGYVLPLLEPEMMTKVTTTTPIATSAVSPRGFPTLLSPSPPSSPSSLSGDSSTSCVSFTRRPRIRMIRRTTSLRSVSRRRKVNNQLQQ